jgi:hypothetical protein
MPQLHVPVLALPGIWRLTVHPDLFAIIAQEILNTCLPGYLFA